ncbi:putative ABC transport system permease protein [Clostridium cavendishii DSM 21758]|uniref:Putative ABC transport system permease protein n=1 Tax=Clostridium cavendishii DSM 21758 TaxID=1121302 RepID=A0A1M6HWS3_9CLOT|nr:ABC transporter permease [Clostridium cavendishii]SHJ26497.1 putative ABC transport system permease protein [Clostridium cavendishii DSM 21758]
MNFKEFASKNVSRNKRVYFAYFLSSSISAALLFSFTMIILHPNFKTELFSDYLIKALWISTVIAYLFLTFFVFYSVSVFLKSRYKEFGVLYIIGASKKQIQRLISIENIIISSVASVIGILLGLVFSKILLAASGKLLGLDALGFYIPFKAMIITFIGFLLIGIVISIFCSFIIKEDMVLKLLKGTKKPKAEPKSSNILVFVCILLLSLGYYFSITASEKTLAGRMIPVTVMVIIATYLLFSELSVFVIKVMKKNRKMYMKKTTLLWVSNLLYRIKDNTRMFFLITITSTVALSATGSVYAYWMDKEAQIDKIFPQAFFISDIYNNKSKIDEKVNFISNSLNIKGMQYSKVTDEMKIISQKKETERIVVIKEGTYKKLAASLSMDIFDFRDNETIVIEYLGESKTENVNLNNVELKIKRAIYNGIIPKFYGKVYVVKDEVYKSIEGNKCYFGAVNLKKYKDTLDVGDKYYNEFGHKDGNEIYNNFIKSDILRANKVAYGVILFSVIFIGLIFFVTTASFLYNKCYMDVIEDKKKYRQLNKIGLTYKEIRKILNIEIGVLFLIPYIVAIIHFFFAISALKYAMDINVSVASIRIILIMIIVQGIYFLVIRKRYLMEIKKSLV